MAYSGPTGPRLLFGGAASVRTRARTYVHIVDKKPASIQGDMCGDLGGMCVQANLHVYAGSRGICAEIWGYVRPAGWVCAAWGSMCAGFWGYVRDMCVR